MEETPPTRYAKSGDVHIAYQVVGEGAMDLVVVPGWVSNVECFWEEPRCAGFLRALAAFSRLIIFDKRGTGLSDRVAYMPSLETRMDDLRAVLSAVGSQRAVLCGYSEGGPMCALFAATYPARTAGLVMLGSYAARAWRADAPWGRTTQQMEQFNRVCESEWGAPLAIERIMPSVAQDESVRQWWGRFLRMSASPAAVVALNTMNHEIDVRPVVASVQAPALVMHARGDQQVDVRHGRELATLLPRARYIELDGEDHAPWLINAGQIVREIEAFTAAIGEPEEPERVLATVTLQAIGLQIRIGLHTGECETVAGKAAGIAVHIGARVSAAAGPGELFVTSTVKDLVAGSGLRFEDRGDCALKGLPDAWHLYAVDLASAA
jgi:pimeloyl-ACP methyl ester carboxylesterase